MTKLVNQDPYKVGLVAVAIGVLLCGLIVIISTISIGTKNYTAHIAHTAGLRPGEDVQVAGVHVGQVKSITLDGDRVLVHFDMRKGIKLGSQTTGEVRVATLLGTHYFQVDPQGGGELKNDSIPLSQTSVPYNLQDIIDRGTAAIQEIDASLIARALSVVAETTEEAKEEFGPALEGIARVSEVIATRSTQVGDLLQAARDVSDQLSESSDDLLGLMRQTSLVLNEIRTRREAIHSLLVKTAALAGALRTIVGTSEKDLGVALENTRRVLGMLKSQDKTLQDALEIMGPASRYLANATGNGPWVDINTPNLAPDAMICKGQGTC